MGGVVILLFIILIDIGYVMSSAACLGDLAKVPDGHWMERTYLLMTFVLSYTASNVALLCCLSAFLGALGERTGIMGRVRTHDATYWRDGIRQYLAAILRGMFVFLVLMSGLMVLGAANFTSPTQAAYGNLAGAASLFSFLIGRDPRMFSKIVEKVNRLEFEKDTPNDANNTHPGTASTILDKDKFVTEVKRTEEHVHAEATGPAVCNDRRQKHTAELSSKTDRQTAEGSESVSYVCP